VLRRAIVRVAICSQALRVPLAECWSIAEGYGTRNAPATVMVAVRDLVAVDSAIARHEVRV
jgi:hypothetical protein